MSQRFRPGAAAYAKDGRRYVIEDVEDGIAYCTSPNGVETEFPESALMTEAEWAARSDGRRDTLYARLRQSPAYAAAPPRLDPRAAEAALAKIERMSPGILDFTAFAAARQFLADQNESAFLSSLSIVKCRAVFDDARPELRAQLLARLLGQQAETLVNAGQLGDNLVRAILDKGMAVHTEDFDEFCDRPRI